MNPALDRRVSALEAVTNPAEPLNLAIQFIGAGVGVTAALLMPSGHRLEREDNESEAAFLTRVEAAR